MSKQVMPLTNSQIKSAKAEQRDISLFDGGGLLLFVKSTGSKTWRFRYNHPSNKKRQTVTLGRYPEITLSEARRSCEELRSQIARGIDPQEYKKKLRSEENERNGNTFEKIAQEWMKLKKSQGRSESTLYQINRILNKYLCPAIGTLPIGDITARIALDAIAPLTAGGKITSANLAAQRLNEVMDYAMNIGVISANPASKISSAILSPKPINRLTIRPEELPELMNSIEGSRLEYQTKLLFEWQLLTIVRPGEAAGTRWSEVNYETKEWSIPAHRMKANRPHIVPLSTQAIEVLKAIEVISKGREFVFPSMRTPNKPMHNQTMNKALWRAGYKNRLVAHGLRSISSTTLNEQGFSPDVIEAALAHKSGDTVRAAYNRSTYLEQRRKVMQWWGDFVDAAKLGVVMLGEGERGLRLVENF